MRIENKIVARYQNGKMVKGVTHDFNPNRDIFHVTEFGGEKRFLEVELPRLKAVFFVKSFDGNKDYKDKEFSKETLKNIPGMKIKVTFLDGEVIYGTSTGYNRQKKGFFLIPADKNGNNERVYVVRNSTEKIETWT